MSAGLPTRAEYLATWSRLHGGAASTGLVGSWLGLSYICARPLARVGVGPDTVTVIGLAVAVSAVPVTAAGGRWPVAAAALVVLSALLDSLDGAVAVLTDRTTRWGPVLDSGCDRIADTAYVLAFWPAGAPGILAAAGAFVAGMHEYLRARAAASGMPEIGVVTVSERPTRVIVASTFLLGVGLYPEDGARWATAGGWAWTLLGLIGLGQLTLTIRRRLR